MDDDISDNDILTGCLDLPLYSPGWNKSANLQQLKSINQLTHISGSTPIGSNMDNFNLPLFESTLDFETMMDFDL